MARLLQIDNENRIWPVDTGINYRIASYIRIYL